MAAASTAQTAKPRPPVCTTCKKKPAEWTTGTGGVNLCGTCFRTYGHASAKTAGAAAAVVPGEIDDQHTKSEDEGSGTEEYDSDDETAQYLTRSRSNSADAGALEDHSAVEDICECERCVWVRAKYYSGPPP